MFETKFIFKLFISASLAVLFQIASAQFVTLKDATCVTGSTFTGWTVGGQYLDPNNGVLQDQWSMLAWWQGDSFVANSVVYDIGKFTAFTERSNEANSRKTSMVQVECR
jgi:hypothetical protein